jgi:hypothetical protein
MLACTVDTVPALDVAATFTTTLGSIRSAAALFLPLLPRTLLGDGMVILVSTCVSALAAFLGAGAVRFVTLDTVEFFVGFVCFVCLVAGAAFDFCCDFVCDFDFDFDSGGALRDGPLRCDAGSVLRFFCGLPASGPPLRFIPVTLGAGPSLLRGPNTPRHWADPQRHSVMFPLEKGLGGQVS